MLLRSIRESLGRYLAILSIVALGVGFFAGLKSSEPAMVATADSYLKQQRMYDFLLMSTLGITEEDVALFQKLDGVSQAEGCYTVAAFAEISGKQEVFTFRSLTEQVDLPELTAGRMPENPGECLVDSLAFSEKDIGSTVTLSPDNDEDTLDSFSLQSFTIVGLARIPSYMSQDRGSTSLGSGEIRGFILLQNEAFDSEVYHELLLFCDFPGEIYSEEYNAARDRMEPEVKKLLNRCGAARYRKLRQEADEELEKARQEIADGWEEYQAAAADAQNQLNSSLETLNAAEAELADGRRQLEDSQKQLDEAREQIPAGLEEIEANRTLLEEKQQELADGRAQLEAAKAELAANEQQLAQSRYLFDQAKALVLDPYRQAVSALESEISRLESQIEELQNEPEPDTAQIDRLNSQLAFARPLLEQAKSALVTAEQQFSSQEQQLIEGEQQLAQAKAQISAQEAELAAGEQQISQGLAELDANEALLRDTLASLDENQAQIDQARLELEQGEAELADGWQQYYSGKEEAEQELKDAEQKLLDAEKEVDDAEAELEETLRLNLYTLDRSSNSGYVTFENDTKIIDGIANAFPLFFALIAALVCVTTMTRMVNEERTQIGTLKAMGYHDLAIMSKYLLYSGSSALIGSILGFFLGTTAIPYIVWYAYSIMYNYAKLSFYFSPLMYTLSLAVSVLGTLGVTWLACRHELAERPAELIRPKAPPKGRRIVLERIKPLWSRLSFLNKVTIRNAFRYKQRVFMMLLGIGGCTALILTGFGVKDSIANVLDYQYGEIFLYDLAVTLDTDEFSSDAQAAELWKEEAGLYAMSYQEEVTLSYGSTDKSTRMIAAEEGALDGIISLHSGGGELPFPQKGEAVIAEKLSDLLGVNVGDTLELRLDSGESLPLTVTGVCDNYLSHYIYVNKASLPYPENNTALLKTDEGCDSETLAARLRSQDGVSYVSSARQEREIMESSMASLDMIVVLLIICSGALAFITLYNLTNINIMERIREIATVKVLGFYPGETASYILRENLMLSFIGAALGLLFGKALHRFVMELIQVEYMSYDVRIAPLSYVIGVLVTLLFALVTNYAMRFKLERVNMAESLKSVE